jgi:hypothetical protein
MTRTDVRHGGGGNRLYFGDNLTVLREHVKDESVDLIYLDPPFNSDVNYNVLFRSPTGQESDAQVEAFRDSWEWADSARDAYADVIEANGDVALVVSSLKKWLGENAMMAYIVMMAARLIELRRVLKPNGSLYLHCDPTASHYLKLVLDAVFGHEKARSEIIWKRTNARGTNWPRLHDTLLMYGSEQTTFFSQSAPADKAKLPHTLITGSDGKKYQTFELTGAGVTKEGQSGQPWRTFNPSQMGRHWGNNHDQMDEWDRAGLIHWPSNGGWPRRKADTPFDPESRRIIVGDVWTDIDRLNQTAKERLGYFYLEVRCLGCDTHQTVALNIVSRPRTTPIHELERYMRCKDCSQIRGYPYKRSHLVALRTTKISASDPPSIWWPGER